MVFRALFASLIFASCGVVSGVYCQTSDVAFPKTKAEGERCIKEEHVCEQLEKLRIAHEKKEHNEMLERAEEALRLSEDLEKSIAANPQLREREREKLQDLEKLVRKIRSELGGKDVDATRNDNDKDDETFDEEEEPKNVNDVVSGFKILRQSTVKLVDEVRKTTRFTISAAAIQSSNAVLRITRMLRFWR